MQTRNVPVDTICAIIQDAAAPAGPNHLGSSAQPRACAPRRRKHEAAMTRERILICKTANGAIDAQFATIPATIHLKTTGASPRSERPVHAVRTSPAKTASGTAGIVQANTEARP